MKWKQREDRRRFEEMTTRNATKTAEAFNLERWHQQLAEEQRLSQRVEAEQRRDEAFRTYQKIEREMRLSAERRRHLIRDLSHMTTQEIYLPKRGDVARDASKDILMAYDGRRWVEYSQWDPDAMPEPEPEAEPFDEVEHKEGHFPIGWMKEAYERAEQSDFLVSIQLEGGGVSVVAKSGDLYGEHTVSWALMDKAQLNPVLVAIAEAEKRLEIALRAAERVNAVS